MPDLDRYQYGYDQNSNRLWKANVVGTPIVSGGLDEYYTYDNLNRLTEMQRGTLNSGKTGITGTPSREMDYTLDPTGNWSAYLTKTAGTTDLNQTRSQNPVNEITAIASTPGWATPPAYDPAGNMTSFSQPASPSSAYTATYDAWNRMVSVSAGGTTVAKYQYDGQNRRALKLTYSGGTLSETRHFYYTSDWQDVEERVGTSTSMDKQYVWGIRYVDELVCRDDSTPQRLYAMQDANFNVTALINTSAAVQERFVYDPYGNSQVLTGSWGSMADAYSWTPRFTGQVFDPETQNYFCRARYYQSMLGRFVGRDPLQYGLLGDFHRVTPYPHLGGSLVGTTGRGRRSEIPRLLANVSQGILNLVSFLESAMQAMQSGATWNLYEFTASNPLNLVDSSGLAFKKCSDAIRQLEAALNGAKNDAEDALELLGEGKRPDAGHMKEYLARSGQIANAMDQVRKYCGGDCASAAVKALLDKAKKMLDDLQGTWAQFLNAVSSGQFIHAAILALQIGSLIGLLLLLLLSLLAAAA